MKERIGKTGEWVQSGEEQETNEKFRRKYRNRKERWKKIKGWMEKGGMGG